MYGTVTMNLPKEDVIIPWAGHMTLDDKDGTLRVRDYHVYGVFTIVSARESDETGQHAVIRGASPSISSREAIRVIYRSNVISYHFIVFMHGYV